MKSDVIEPSAEASGSALLAAAKRADWTQIALNGGPPCFHLEKRRFCLRANHWVGHSSDHALEALEWKDKAQ